MLANWLYLHILGTNTFKATLIFAKTVGKDWIGVVIKK